MSEAENRSAQHGAVPLRRRTEGRDEPILDPGLAIIDSHHHLFDRAPTRYLFEEYLEDANAGHNIVASVYVETLSMARPYGPELFRPLGEVEFANGVAAMSASGTYGPRRVAAAIVGYADLSKGDAIGDLLDRSIAAAPDRFRGVRQLTLDHPSETPFQFMTHRPPPGILERPAFYDGFRQLANRGLTYDAAVFHHQLPTIGRLAEAFPDTVIVLNHLGLAMAMGMNDQEKIEVFASWRKELQEFARHSNVVCKIGGLGLPFWGFGFENRPEPIDSLELAAVWGPYVETALEAFGVQRCLMESNYPMDSRSSGFVPLWNALKQVVVGCSQSEKSELFHGTAARIYGIDLQQG